ncbi:MAG: MmpS family transport accessory protein [Mycobacterium sp.]
MSTTPKMCAFLSLCVTGAVAVAGPRAASASPGDVVFEVTGSGRAYTVDTDPSTQRYYDVKLPWQKNVTIDPSVQMLQVVAVGKGSPTPGCRITLDGTVVAEKPPGQDSQCIWNR